MILLYPTGPSDDEINVIFMEWGGLDTLHPSKSPPPPPSDALGHAARLFSPPADSDGSDSFQWWPPVLTPIRLGDSGKLARGSTHICLADTAEKTRGEGGGGCCSCREPVSTFNLCFTYLRFCN